MDGIERELDREALIALVLVLRAENAQLRRRIEKLEGKRPTKRLDESYSLQAVPAKETFEGILVSDNAAVYRGFSSARKCGARRRTVLVSVFASLRLHLSEFTLSSVLQEIHTWSTTGTSLFERLLKSSGLAPPQASTLDNLLPLTTT